MLFKKLGDKKISALCYGCGDISKPNHVKYIKYAIKTGINYFDTSENYHNGKSETVLGIAIKNHRKKYIISTKVAPENLKYDDVIKSCESSLKRLQTDYIDIYYIHWPNSVIPIEETCSALIYLTTQGKILNIGICNFAYEQLI